MRNKITTLFICCQLLSFSSRADNLEKGFQRLRIFDFFQAKECFEKSLQKKTAGAAYGLSVIFSLNNNPFYNLDSARIYILKCDTHYLSLKEKEKKEYETFGITAVTIQLMKDTICKKTYQKFSSTSSIGILNAYLKNFSFCAETGDVLLLRDAIAYRDAKEINTSSAYRYFIATYPESKQHLDAIIRLDGRIYEETTADNKISSYEKFISENPASPNKIHAEKMIYTLSVKNKTVDAYYGYIRKYPSGKYINDAWREIFKLSTKNYSEEAITDFKNRYPDYPFKDELETDYRLQQSLFLPFSKNNLWGFINDDGEEMIKPAYEEVQSFSEGLAVAKKNGKYGYINKTGRAIIPFLFDDADAFKNNMAIVMRSDKSGLIGRGGEELIPLLYDELGDPSESICVAVLNEKSGYVTTSGKKLTEFIFDFAGDFRDGYAIAGAEEKNGLLNSAGRFVIEPQYEELIFMSNGNLKARQNLRWGIINVKGETIVSFDNDAIGDFSENRALIAKNKKCGFINDRGEIIIPVAYPYFESFLSTAIFKDGFVLLKQKYKSVLLDSAGTKVSFSGVEDFGMPSAGFFPVKKNKKWGYADITGKIKIPCVYESAASFENGFAKIKIKNLFGVIDTSGRTVVAPAFEDVICKNNFFITRESGRSGLMNTEGGIILPGEYERIEFLSNKIISAFRNENLFYLNLQTAKIIRKEKE